jgi:hypothetical protein
MNTKLFLLGLILVLAALLAAPVMADANTTGNTDVTGQVTSATISITPPSAVNLGPFVMGDRTGSSLTPGTVTVIAGTAGFPVAGIAYVVSTKDSNAGAGKGFMMNGTTQLSTTNKFMISPDGTTYYPADTGFSYQGSATDAKAMNLPFYAKQTIDGTETIGTYGIKITFTASLP